MGARSETRYRKFLRDQVTREYSTKAVERPTFPVRTLIHLITQGKIVMTEDYSVGQYATATNQEYPWAIFGKNSLELLSNSPEAIAIELAKLVSPEALFCAMEKRISDW
jgi:hypothetical protein